MYRDASGAAEKALRLLSIRPTFVSYLAAEAVRAYSSATPMNKSTSDSTLKKTVFFDRDGTLIIDRVYLNDPDQITYLPGVFEALAKLRDAGYQFVIVTNQSGVARGIVSLENLAEIHRRISVEFKKHSIEFAGIYSAPY